MERIIQVFVQPDAKLRKETFSILKKFAKKYGAYKAYKDWKGPHITVYTMRADYGEIGGLIEKAKSVIKDVKQFKVYIEGIGYFMKADSTGKRNYVIFLRVKKTRELINLWRILNKNLHEYRASFPKYVPHLTITRQDLDKKKFYAALREYKDLKFSGHFRVVEVKVSTRDKDIQKIIVHTVKLKRDN